MSDPKLNDDDIRILLGLYASERSDGAALMSAGFAQVVAMLAYVGVSATLIGKGPIPEPFVILAVPIPALVLLITYTIHGFNQGLRATSGATLEELLLRATSPAVTSATVGDVASSTSRLGSRDFRDGGGAQLLSVAIGLRASELFYNDARANSRQRLFLAFYYASAGIVVFAFCGLAVGLGLFDAYGGHRGHDWTYWQWALLWSETGAIAGLAALFGWATKSGVAHRDRALVAAEFVLAPPQEPDDVDGPDQINL